MIELRNKDLTNNNESDSNCGDDEVDAFIERLVEIQEKLIPDFRKSFDPSTLLEKQQEIYVSLLILIVEYKIPFRSQPVDRNLMKNSHPLVELHEIRIMLKALSVFSHEKV